MHFYYLPSLLLMFSPSFYVSHHSFPSFPSFTIHFLIFVLCFTPLFSLPYLRGSLLHSLASSIHLFPQPTFTRTLPLLSSVSLLNPFPLHLSSHFLHLSFYTVLPHSFPSCFLHLSLKYFRSHFLLSHFLHLSLSKVCPHSYSCLLPPSFSSSRFFHLSPC